MTTDQETPKNHLQNEKSLSDKDLYTKIANDSIRYIQTEKRYLVLSIIFPIFIILSQIINLILIILDYIRLNEILPRPRPIVDIIFPVFIFIVVSTFLIIHLAYLLKWNSKVNNYQKHRYTTEFENNNEQTNDSKEYISLSQIFYDIINHMRNIRIVFYGLNAVSALYFLFILREILGNFRVIILREFLYKLPWMILNSIAFVIMMIYLIIQWQYFLKWNRKLEKIEEYEKSIYLKLKLE